MNLTSSGMPGGTFKSVSDDGAEAANLVNGTSTWGWNNLNTDGGMVSGLESSTWSIDLLINSFSGLGNGFAFVTGPSATGSGDISLDITAGDTITITATEVPAPAAVFCLLLGLAGLAMRRTPSTG